MVLGTVQRWRTKQIFTNHYDSNTYYNGALAMGQASSAWFMTGITFIAVHSE